MRKIKVAITDAVVGNSLMCKVSPSVITLGGIAREHKATCIVFTLPESWDTNDGSFFVECESNNGEAALSDALLVEEENGKKIINFEIPYSMTSAGIAEFTLKHNIYADDNKTLVKSVRSAKLRAIFHDTTNVEGENKKIAEDLLGGMITEVNGLVSRFNNGEFNGQDGAPGAPGVPGVPGADATINGVNALIIKQGKGIEFEQKEDVLEISSNSVPKVFELPAEAFNGDICLYAAPNLLKHRDSAGNIVISVDELQEMSQNNIDAEFDMILRKDGAVVAEFYLYSYTDPSVCLVYYDIDNAQEYQICFDNGMFNQENSIINGENASLDDFCEKLERLSVPDFNSFEMFNTFPDGELPERYRYTSQLMEYNNGWCESSSLLELTEKAHRHNNKKTLDGFYCESLETGFATDVSSEQLKWQGKPIEFQGFGAKIKRITEVENNGSKFMRLWLDWGSMSFVDSNTNFIDIPVAEVKNSIIEDDGGFIINGSEIEFDTTESNGIKIVNELPADAKIGDVICLPKATERQAISAADIVPGETIITAIKANFDVDYSNYPSLTENYWISLAGTDYENRVPWLEWHWNDEYTSILGASFFRIAYETENGSVMNVCLPDIADFNGSPVRAGWYSLNPETYEITPLNQEELLSFDNVSFVIDSDSISNAVFDNFVTFFTGEEYCKVDFYYYTGTEWVLMVDGINDVKIKGESIVTAGVANIPIAEPNKPGLIGFSPTNGLSRSGSNIIPLNIKNHADNRNNAFMSYANLDHAVKAAMCDGKGTAWTADEQAAARERIGIGDYEPSISTDLNDLKTALANLQMRFDSFEADVTAIEALIDESGVLA